MPISPSARLLTERQRQTLLLWSSGLSAEEVASRLGLRRRTVLKYLADARQRLGATNDAHLLRLSLEAGLFQRPTDHFSQAG